MCLAALGVASRREMSWRLRGASVGVPGRGGDPTLLSVRPKRGLGAGGLFLALPPLGPAGGGRGRFGVGGFVRGPSQFLAGPGSYKPGDAASSKRLDLWRTAWDGILHKPWLGWGPGQFEALYRLHARAQDGALLRFDHSTLFAHNDYLQAAAASGLPALICLLWLLVTLFRSLSAGAARRAAVFLAGCVFSLFQLPFRVACERLRRRGGGSPRALPEGPRPRPARPRSGGRGGAFCPPFFLGDGGLPPFAAAFRFRARDRPNGCSTAVRRCCWKKASGRCSPPAAWSGRTALLSEGRARLAPGRAENWEASAILRSFEGKPDEAEASLREALRLYPRNAVWWVELGWLESERGRPTMRRRRPSTRRSGRSRVSSRPPTVWGS